VAGDGDISFGRLNHIPYPETGIHWWHAMPPLVLLFLTRYGIPVSTTFLVLTLFALTGGAATEGVLGKMLIKSLLGYVVAFAAGAAVYVVIARKFEMWVHRTQTDRAPHYWVAMQWLSTAFLWSQWLMQDLANIFVFLPRTTELVDGHTVVHFNGQMIIFATLVMVLLQGYIFALRGGEIQKIVLSKVNTTDIRAATIVDLIYGLILLVFKEMSDIPMSTTWVFLGLLAGRELAISWMTQVLDGRAAGFAVAKDVLRAGFGLLVSVLLAFGVPWLATGEIPRF
jgi:hypothetical protein